MTEQLAQAAVAFAGSEKGEGVAQVDKDQLAM